MFCYVTPLSCYTVIMCYIATIQHWNRLVVSSNPAGRRPRGVPETSSRTPWLIDKSAGGPPFFTILHGTHVLLHDLLYNTVIKACYITCSFI